MKSRTVPRAAAGFAFVFLAGLAVTLLPAAGASPSPTVRPLEFAGPGTTAVGAPVHSIAAQSPCLVTVSLVASAQVAHVGFPVQLTASTGVQPIVGGASCPLPVLYTWTLLPGGCVAASTPTLACTPMTGGLYHPTVLVGFSDGTQLRATAVITVLSGP